MLIAGQAVFFFAATCPHPVVLRAQMFGQRRETGMQDVAGLQHMWTLGGSPLNMETCDGIVH
jgi:hypothetical protein